MPRFGIKYWLLTANLFILLVPAFGLVFLRMWDRHLVRVTEEHLIAKSHVVADVWSFAVDGGAGETVERARHRTFAPRLDQGYDVADTVEAFARFAAVPGPRPPAGVAAAVRGAEEGGRTAVDLLDATGCAVASTVATPGTCYGETPEVRRALGGDYEAVTRERAGAGSFSLADIGHYGSVRVFTAMPVLSGDEVIGVVRMSERSSGPLEAVWDHRRTVLLGGGACLLLMFVVTHFFSRAISRPVQELTASAERVARGEPPRATRLSRAAPSELASLGSAVERMTSQLTDRAEYIAGFATTVSHEMKTPIAGIRGAIELLRDDWQQMTEAQRRRFLENIDADARRMERLVTRLLELARIQSAPEAVEAIDVEAFFAEVAGVYGARVDLLMEDAPRRVLMNRDHLENAVRNLIDNAIRHGGGVAVEVRVGSRDGRLEVAVRDHGPGISEGNRKRIFDRFFTTDRDAGGTGLGLAIVQAVAETRNGSVSFDTGPDGSTFRLQV